MSRSSLKSSRDADEGEGGVEPLIGFAERK